MRRRILPERKGRKEGGRKKQREGPENHLFLAIHVDLREVQLEIRTIEVPGSIDGPTRETSTPRGPRTRVPGLPGVGKLGWRHARRWRAGVEARGVPGTRGVGVLGWKSARG